MEPIGLAFGAVGLATLFSTCIDCFAFVEYGRAYGRDYEILLTKFDIEKTRLLQWGDGVGLLSMSKDKQNGHSLLDNKVTGLMIERVLQCIAVLLTDADQLRSKYGTG